MTFDLKRMLESKKALRRKLADRPLAEKLAMLDALRERALAIRKAAASLRDSAVHETPEKYRTGQNKGEISNIVGRPGKAARNLVTL